MDDGSLQNKGLHLNTYGFTHEGILNLKETLENMFGENSLKCSIHKHKKGWRSWRSWRSWRREKKSKRGEGDYYHNKKYWLIFGP